MGGYIWYSVEETKRGSSPPGPLLAVPNATAHPSTASVLIAILLYNGPLLCSSNAGINRLICLNCLCKKGRFFAVAAAACCWRKFAHVDGRRLDTCFNAWQHVSDRTSVPLHARPEANQLQTTCACAASMRHLGSTNITQTTLRGILGRTSVFDQRTFPVLRSTYS